jgi:hypothetical protein
MLNPHIQTLARLLAQQAAKSFLQSPELVNSYYLLDKAKRPVLLERARKISGRKS